MVKERNCNTGYGISRVHISLLVANTHTHAPGMGKSRVQVRVHFLYPQLIPIPVLQVWVNPRYGCGYDH